VTDLAVVAIEFFSVEVLGSGGLGSREKYDGDRDRQQVELNAFHGYLQCRFGSVAEILLKVFNDIHEYRHFDKY
jgi:hypothetical protein